MQNWAPLLQNQGVTTHTCWRLWGLCLPSYDSGMSFYSSGMVFTGSKKNLTASNIILTKILSTSRPSVASYVSLAFGHYVVEPFFTPCAAPIVLIRLVSILGVSECFYNSSVSGALYV